MAITNRNSGHRISPAPAKNSAVYKIVVKKLPTWTVPDDAAPAISDRMSQPTVSSTTPAERMTRPMLRLVRSRSIRILAITGIAEIDIAVARNRLKRMR